MARFSTVKESKFGYNEGGGDSIQPPERSPESTVEKMPQGPILDSHPTEFFRDLVRQAMQAQGFEAIEETEYYLVALLENHLRTQGGLLDKPLALTYLEAEAGAPSESFQRFKKVGDTALFVSGLFVDCLERTTVQPAYYVELGQLAYRRIADGGASRVRDMFETLSTRFADLVRVLGTISARELFPSDRDTLRIYRRWLLTRGSRDAAELIRRGLIPGEPSRLHH